MADQPITRCADGFKGGKSVEIVSEEGDNSRSYSDDEKNLDRFMGQDTVIKDKDRRTKCNAV